MKRRLAVRSSLTLVAVLALVAATGAGILLASGGNSDDDTSEPQVSQNATSDGRAEDGENGSAVLEGDSAGNGNATTSSSAPGKASKAGSGRGGVRLAEIGRFDQPVFLTGAPGNPNLTFVVEQPGRVRVMRGNRVMRRPFLNISGRVQDGGERGLLSIAFPPNYQRSGRFYVYYTDATGDIRIDEFRRRNATVARPNTRRTVLRIAHREHSNHNGGQLAFLGNHLYIGTGDGGGGGDPRGNAQARQSLLGKLLRIDPRPNRDRPYSIPRENPFFGGEGRPEIYSYGLRNPWRFSFDLRRVRQPRIAIADVGQSAWEEINYLTVADARGANFGWNRREGFEPYEGGSAADTTPPIFAYGRNQGCSITGGHVVTDRRLRTLRGRYIFADFCEGELRSLAPRFGRVRSAPGVGPRVASPSSFGQDGRGRSYITSLSGSVYRLVPR